MRKLLTSVSAVAIAGFAAFGIVKAANIPLFSNIALQEPSQELAALNTLVQAINSGVTGNYGYVPGPVGNAGSSNTTANFTFASTSIPTASITQVGQGYRARCSGQATVSTTFKVGIAVGRSMQVSLENFAGSTGNDAIGPQPNWDLEIQFHAATNPVTGNYTWMGRGFAAQPTGTATGQMSMVSGNDTTGDNNNLAPITVNCVWYGGIATGLATMNNFVVEQLR
jgi:hypothetical protein